MSLIQLLPGIPNSRVQERSQCLLQLFPDVKCLEGSIETYMHKNKKYLKHVDSREIVVFMLTLFLRQLVYYN